ncbi:PH domain-containing protein [Crossiella sp. CA-258035]|uniref:PH domain-containing protein n=1 Tax=Crossiella sp. CA-258035 TaxID=2981138 RepID=UPI0024BD339F|nr:PH domain-containing protein [Crossiella sp. CA-258035]WHT18156.1 PH domain-containing protein [Crossiella sp. CA-258035]
MIPAALLFVCATPLAFGAPGLQVVYLVPLALVLWVIRTRTVVDAEQVRIRTLFGARSIVWSDIAALRLTKASGVKAVLTDDSEVTLPAVRVRDLDALARASGGRFGEPEPAAETEPAEPDPTDEPR